MGVRLHVQGLRDMERQKLTRRLYWPALAIIFAIYPLYLFREEESTLYVVFRVAWVAVIIFSLFEIGRIVFRDLHGRRGD